MTARATIELRDLPIQTTIGTYPAGVPAPTDHRLDLTLSIDPSLVLIEQDGMDRVFDYDPLVAELERLAADGPYDTQERLITRMAVACAAHLPVQALELALRKGPMRDGSGSLGVRVFLDGPELHALRSRKP
ncbi:MAG: dihydroneopterin aldolase [Hydrogenophaga sp.]